MGILDEFLRDKLEEKAENLINKLSGNKDSKKSSPTENEKSHEQKNEQIEKKNGQKETEQHPTMSNATSEGVYNNELEKLIEMALMDGVLTEQEKRVLFKKAESFGIDLDEFEMVLEARLYEKQQTTKKTEAPLSSAPKSDKSKELRKCPACGAILQSFSVQCPDCGYEFRNMEANASVKTLSDKLAQITEECNNKLYDEDEYEYEVIQEFREKDIEKRQIEIITNFPVPNTKEDMLELLHFIYPKIRIGARSYQKAWESKCIEIINRIKMIYSNDSKMMDEVNKIMDEINKFEARKRRNKMLVIFGSIGALILIGIIVIVIIIVAN